MGEQDFLAGVLVGWSSSGEGSNGEYSKLRGDDEWLAQYLCQAWICGELYDWRAACDWETGVTEND